MLTRSSSAPSSFSHRASRRLAQMASALLVGRLSDCIGRFPFVMIMHALAFMGSLFGHFATEQPTTTAGISFFYIAFIMFGVFDACTQTQVREVAVIGEGGRGRERT